MAKKKGVQTRELRNKPQTVTNPHIKPSTRKTKVSGLGEQKESASSQDVPTLVKGRETRISSRGGSKNTHKNRKTIDSTWTRFNRFTLNPTWKVSMDQI